MIPNQIPNSSKTKSPLRKFAHDGRDVTILAANREHANFLDDLLPTRRRIQIRVAAGDPGFSLLNMEPTKSPLPFPLGSASLGDPYPRNLAVLADHHTIETLAHRLLIELDRYNIENLSPDTLNAAELGSKLVRLGASMRMHPDSTTPSQLLLPWEAAALQKITSRLESESE